MAHLTNSAVDTVLGALKKAVKDEAKLLSSVEGDIQFIRDELDSMNGFLLYLTKNKSTAPHDDQVRAWMKQVRDLAYVADDCVKLYRRDLTPPEPGLLPWLRHFPAWLKTIGTRHRLAKKIHKLKERVREVGERRQRYDVKIPSQSQGDGDTDDTMKSNQLVIGQDGKSDEQRRKLLEDGLRALEDGKADPLKVQDAINKILFPGGDAKDEETCTSEIIHKIVRRCLERNHVTSVKMLLRALYTKPYDITQAELEGLLRKPKEDRSFGPVDVPHQVMVFCYSKLSTHHKSCLQYLTTFDKENSISRTCLVRRWLAEGTVAKQADEGSNLADDNSISMEEAGERYFDELVSRGFISPAPPVLPTDLKIKNCLVDPPVKEFIAKISKADNFIDDLPTHLTHQIQIRELAQREKQPLQYYKPWWRTLMPPTVSGVPTATVDGEPLPPMDEMVKLLKELPEEYRLNVLDLGGCTGLKMYHLKKICELVPSLKYLSLRKTNIYWLPKQMSDLLNLETLDIRDTRVQANAMRNIFLQELKHLLAGRSGVDATLPYTVKIPKKIGKNTEILKHVQIKDGHAQSELGRVASLKRLRKLGVVLSGSQDNMAHLLRAIGTRRESLRSLSVWIMPPPIKNMAAGDGGFMTVDTIAIDGEQLFSFPKKLESLNIKCFKGNNNTRGRIPQWVKGHQYLSKITLRHSLLTEDDLSALGKLISLHCLRLCRESYIDHTVIFKVDEFKELRFLMLDHVSNKTKKLEFQDGAVPKLEKIVWNLDVNMAGAITVDKSRLESLPRLMELKINSDPYYTNRFPSQPPHSDYVEIPTQ
uniref:Uncharacterized protein n=1 Tax=Leersia perrieri TaxID=77586 RepID=A0A0D9XUU9_9ORYZ